MQRFARGLLASLALVTGCKGEPQTADEIIARSVKAHGGEEALTTWQTMTVKGEVNQQDGRLWFRGEYLVYAQKPDKLRIERGRLFFCEILNGGKGWMIRNLIPSYREELAGIYKAKLDRLDGIAFYAQNADRFQLVPLEEDGDLIDRLLEYNPNVGKAAEGKNRISNRGAQANLDSECPAVFQEIASSISARTALPASAVGIPKITKILFPERTATTFP